MVLTQNKSMLMQQNSSSASFVTQTNSLDIFNSNEKKPEGTGKKNHTFEFSRKCNKMTFCRLVLMYNIEPQYSIVLCPGESLFIAKLVSFQSVG